MPIGMARRTLPVVLLAVVLLSAGLWWGSAAKLSAGNGSVRAAVAANFTAAARAIATAFEAATGDTPLLSFGSTGQLYAQIAQGAPFDVLLAADQERPGTRGA